MLVSNWYLTIVFYPLFLFVAEKIMQKVQEKILHGLIAERTVLRLLLRLKRISGGKIRIITDFQIKNANIDFILIAPAGIFLIEVKSSKVDYQQATKQLNFNKYLLKKMLRDTLPGIRFPVSGFLCNSEDRKSLKELEKLIKVACFSEKIFEKIFIDRLEERLLRMVGPRGFEPRTNGL